MSKNHYVTREDNAYCVWGGPSIKNSDGSFSLACLATFPKYTENGPDFEAERKAKALAEKLNEK